MKKWNRKKILYLHIALFWVLLVSSFIIFMRIPETATFVEIQKHKIKTFQINFKISSNLTLLKKIMYKAVNMSVSKYIEKCIGSDYYHPITDDCSNHSGLGITAISSLDTVYIMENHKLYKKLRKWTEKHFTCKQNRFLHTKDLFSHIIAGLISIYTLTGDEMYLNKLDDCVDVVSHSFQKSILMPLVHGTLPISKHYPFIHGTSLADSSSFLLESKALYHYLNIDRFKANINNYLEHMRIYTNTGFPIVLSSRNISDITRISTFSAGFYANILRSYIYKETETEKILIDNLIEKTKYETLSSMTGFSSENENIFNSENCQLVPLLYKINLTDNNLYKRISERCFIMSRDSLPLAKEYVNSYLFEFIETPFNFDSSLIEQQLLENKSLMDLMFTRYIDDPQREGVFCSLESQDPIRFDDFLPPESISRWAKLIYLDQTEITYNDFVFNEAGHFIPK